MRLTVSLSRPLATKRSNSRPASGAITKDTMVGASAKNPASCKSAPNSRLTKVGNYDNTKYKDQLMQICAMAIAHTALERSMPRTVSRG